jgi:hypothetical protein
MLAATASFTGTQKQNSPATGTFTWQTDSSHAREQPYDVLFQVRDYSINGHLTDIHLYRIRVVASAETCTTSPLSTSTNKSYSGKINIYPNPATDIITISMSEIDGTNGYLIISSLDGKEIRSQKITEQDFQLDISALQRGLYFLKIQYGAKAWIKRFVKL